MLAIKNLDGEVFLLTGASNIVRKRRVNGEKELSLKLDKTLQNAKFFDDIEKLWRIIDFDGEEYPILLYRDIAVGDGYQREFNCLHSFFDDMRNHVIYESFTGSKTFDAMMDFIFAGSGYAYNIIGTFYAQDFENFGDDYGLELFKKAIERYIAEFSVNDKVVSLRTKIGNTTDFQYRHKFNLQSIERNVDALDFSTYGEGFGKDGLHVTYRSPLADIYGDRPIKAIRDERFTVAENLTERVKEAVESSLKIALTVKLADLRTSGYNKNHPNEGDTIILVDERLGLKIDTRIVEIVELFNKKGEVIDCDVTLSNYSNIFEQQRRIHNATKTIADAVEGKRPLPFEALAVAVQQATIALQNAQTELHFPDNGGILAIKKDNPNHLVLYNSAGLGISIDGGQTFKSAITAEGIVADTIVIGFMLADRIKGGTLTLGGEENGRFTLLDANGEIVAELDGALGGFQWLRIGDVISNSVVKRGDGLVYYVHPSQGSDLNTGRDLGSQLATIQEALNRLPKHLNTYAEIRVASSANANWNENIRISGFGGASRVFLNFQSTNNTLNGTIEVMNCSEVEIRNAKVNFANSDQDFVILSQNSTTRVYNSVVYGRNQAQFGYHALYGKLIVESSEGYDLNTAVINGSWASNLFARNNKGLAPYGIRAMGGTTIGGEGTAPAGSTSDIAEVAGGVVEGTFTHDSGAATPPPSPDTTKEWEATDSASYTESAAVWDNTTGRDVLQGKWYSAGRYRGLWFFGSALSTTVTGKTIKKIRVFLTRAPKSGYSKAVAAVIRPHGYTSKPSGQPSYLGVSHNVDFAWDEGKWVTLPSSFHSYFQSGSAKGLMIYTTSTSNGDYMRFSGNAKIEITYG